MNKEKVLARQIVGLVQADVKGIEETIDIVEEMIKEIIDDRDVFRLNPMTEPLGNSVRENMLDFEGLARKILKKKPTMEWFFIEDLNPMGKRLIQFKKNAKRRPTTIEKYNRYYDGVLKLEFTPESNLKVTINKDYFVKNG